MKTFKVLLLKLLPHHALSRLVGSFTGSARFPYRHRIMKWLARVYCINMDEAIEPRIDAYPTPNSCFTRALKPEVRPFDSRPNVFCSPVDGTLGQLGKIQQNRLYQAKGHEFTLEELLGGREKSAQEFINGRYATAYLSPKDYHRVHMPYGGRLRETIHVPGRLFSVAPLYVERIPRLFARNERVISLFDTPQGSLAVILVGAIFVSSMETVWAGLITPPQARRVQLVNYVNGAAPIILDKGSEMGRFNMGSTVIVLVANSNFAWDTSLTAGSALRMGQTMGQF